MDVRNVLPLTNVLNVTLNSYLNLMLAPNQKPNVLLMITLLKNVPIVEKDTLLNLMVLVKLVVAIKSVPKTVRLNSSTALMENI